MKNQPLNHWWYTNIILLLLSGFFCHSIMGQTTYFEKQYHDPTLFGSILATDTGYIAFGVATKSDVRPWAVYAIDLKGDTVWTKTYGKAPEAWFSVDILPAENGYYQHGSIKDTLNGNESDIIIGRYNKNGSEIWFKRYNTPGVYDVTNKVIILKDGGFLLAGWVAPDLSQYKNHFLVMRLDSNGNLIWKKVFEREWGIASLLSAIELENGDLILSGYEENAHEDFDVQLMRLNANGAIIWEEEIGGEFRDAYNDILKINEETIWLTGATATSRNVNSFRIICVKVNLLDGTVTDSLKFPQYNRGFVSAPPILEKDGSMIIPATYFPNQDELGLVLKIDSIGEVLWERTYFTDSTRTNTFYDIAPTLDQGYVLAGSSFYPPDSSFSNVNHGWVLKLDCHGADSVHYYYPNTACGEVLSISETTPKTTAFKVFPNPANEIVTITSKNGDKVTSIAVQTINGQTIPTKMNKGLNNEVKLDVSTLPQGFYIMKISTENGITESQPFLVE